MSPAEQLDAEKLRAELCGQRIGNRILVLQEATSTNDVVAELAPTHAEGLVVFAERQTAGRGQYGRSWDSAAYRGLWASVLLRPSITVSESSRLTELLAQTIVATLAEFRIAASIKPPNDIYVGSRKVAGVLVEMRVERAGAYCAIAGIGVNINHASDDFPNELRDKAASIAMLLGRAVDRQAFAVALLRQLESRYRGFSESSATRAAS